MGFQKVDFVVAEEVNPYINDVAEFAAENGEDYSPAFAVDVPANQQAKHETWVRKAAHLVDRTARLRKVDNSAVKIEGQTEKGRDIKSGTVVLTYTLTAKHKEGKGVKGGAKAIAEAAEENQPGVEEVKDSKPAKA
jgi:Cu/Ag efflux protein CusF